ncbi:FAD-dependent oxidoreductase [Mycolicibacterium smegmatis]|uniref:FAD-dependent oxidoreductase n=1 Tax=Mycolicibacterium smegmatis TaxID=1772 RepID=UPI001303B2D6|nr:2-polyprenyl-6-methoxyphenol hydroxylase-like oxidoreductase [Mycolicibacterium smegmatis]
MSRIGARAVVLGGSFSGLLSARVLSEFYDEVSVVERDPLTTDAMPRRGVPQARHGHALQSGGAEALDRLFPGLLAELSASGAVVLENRDVSRVKLCLQGHWLKTSGVMARPATMYSASRGFLEMMIRRRVFGIPNVKILDAHDAVEILAGTPERITGVQVANRHGGELHVIEADLVLDAMGRGARTPALLESLGYGRPAEDSVTVNVNYVSQMLRLPAGLVDEAVILVGATPERPTGGTLFAYENDTWMLTAAGVGGTEPPTDLAGRQRFIAELGVPQLDAALREGTPLTEPHRHRLPDGRRRRYEEMRRFPAGLLALGDAICSFNPVYGQGMTVAAFEAAALREVLRDGDRDLARRFFSAAAEFIDPAWRMAVNSDLALPQIPGRRTAGVRLSNWLTGHILAAAAVDDGVAEQFLRVMSMVDPPSRLFRPSMLWRVAEHSQRRHRRVP